MNKLLKLSMVELFTIHVKFSQLIDQSLMDEMTQKLNDQKNDTDHFFI